MIALQCNSSVLFASVPLESYTTSNIFKCSNLTCELFPQVHKSIKNASESALTISLRQDPRMETHSMNYFEALRFVPRHRSRRTQTFTLKRLIDSFQTEPLFSASLSLRNINTRLSLTSRSNSSIAK